jgi:pimeloyl-ACP methyl ester carboxylesterase
VFPVQAFPMNAVDSFLQHLVPTVSDNPQIISGALVALLDKIGPAIVVTHSQSGLFGWLAGARSPNVKGIVSYEPGFVFEQRAVPAPIPLFKGTQTAGTPVSAAEFANLAKIPLQVVYGDNIPREPIPDLIADGRGPDRGWPPRASRHVETLCRCAQREGRQGQRPSFARRGPARQLALHVLRPEQHRGCGSDVSVLTEAWTGSALICLFGDDDATAFER